MNSPWKITQLREVIRHRKYFITIDDLKEYKRCRVQLHAKGIVLRDFIEGARIKTKQQKLCQAGELLVAEIDAKVGGYGIVPGDLDGAIVSSHYFLFKINERRLNCRFLDYFIRTPYFYDQVSARGSTNYAAVRPHHILEYEIPLPPLSEQKRIVARIEELAAKVEEAQQFNIDSYGYSSMLLSGAIRDIFKECHASRRLVLDIQVVSGATPDTKNPIFWDGDIVWITPKDLGSLKSRDVLSSRRALSRFGLDNCSARIVPIGTVIMSSRAPIGHLGIARVPLSTNQGCKSFLVPEDTLPDFFYYALKSRLLMIKARGSGTTFHEVSTSKLRGIEVPHAPMDEQRRIVAYLDDLQAKVDTLRHLQEQASAKLDALLPAILDKAFKGEL